MRESASEARESGCEVSCRDRPEAARASANNCNLCSCLQCQRVFARSSRPPKNAPRRFGPPQRPLWPTHPRLFFEPSSSRSVPTAKVCPWAVRPGCPQPHAPLLSQPKQPRSCINWPTPTHTDRSSRRKRPRRSTSLTDLVSKKLLKS
jgi:hypothetical protein